MADDPINPSHYREGYAKARMGLVFEGSLSSKT